MSNSRAIPSRALRPAFALLAALVAALALFAAPAGAHSDDGEMTVLRAEQSGPSTIEVEVGIVYADQHLAEEARVTATATKDGETAGPVTLEGGGPGSRLAGGLSSSSGSSPARIVSLRARVADAPSPTGSTPRGW